jgi:chemotaxis protein histidine kinase CheA
MQLFNGATQENIRLSPKNWAGITIKAGKLSPRQPAPKGATIIPYGATGKPVTLTPKEIQAEKDEAERSRLILKNAYGEDSSKWQKSAQVAAGLIKDPLLNQASVSFINFFKEYGPDYRKWSPPQQKAAGIDLNIPYYSVEQSKQQNVFAIFSDTTDTDEKNNLLSQYIKSKNGLMNLKDQDIFYIAYGIRDNIFDKSFLSPEEAKNLLNRDDLTKDTKFYLNEIGKIKQQQPPAANKEPAAQTPPPAAQTPPPAANKSADEKAKRQQEIVNELDDVDKQLEEVSDLLILLNSMEATEENIQKTALLNKK